MKNCERYRALRDEGRVDAVRGRGGASPRDRGAVPRPATPDARKAGGKVSKSVLYTLFSV